jgi:hypothetical protein
MTAVGAKPGWKIRTEGYASILPVTARPPTAPRAWVTVSRFDALTALLALVTVGLLLAVPLFASSGGSPALAPSGIHPDVAVNTVTVGDGMTGQAGAPTNASVRDSITYGVSTGSSRAYTIHLNVSGPAPGESILVQTDPIAQWGLPDQLPGGADSLPALSLWSWTVWDGTTRNLTTSWTATVWDQQLSGTVAWGTQSISIYGTSAPLVAVTVNPSELDGNLAPGVGFVMNTPGVAGTIPENDSTFTATAAALHPQLVRFSTTGAGTVLSWDTATNEPRYNFTYFDALLHFSQSVGAETLINFPAGTWGDGNILPTGMPVNTSITVPGAGEVGYFPNNTAWTSYVSGIVNHTIASHETITYWSVGNEFPTDSQSLVAGYTNIFNLAAKAIHAKIPGALVGSDVMTNSTYEPYFAAHALGVGFLSFHYYPSVGLCVVNGTYCAPRGNGLGSTDEGMFSHTSYQYLTGMHGPAIAVSDWKHWTGDTLPILNTETNLNGFGGSYGTLTLGTDPRTQTLFGAAWVESLLIDSANQNVSDLAYFALSSGWGVPNTVTAPYGGFGYGLTSEAPNRTNTLYAPYYALELWGESIPAGAPGLTTNSSAPLTIYPYAAMDGANLSVVLVNRANVPVTVDVNVLASKYSLASVSTLDQRSYNEVYEPSEKKTVIESAGVATSHTAKTSSILIDGYGVAVATYTLAGHSGNQSTNTTGNQTGDGNDTGNSTGSGTGNSTDNSTGNSTGSGTGNTTGNSTGNDTGSGTGNATGNSTGSGAGNSTGNTTGSGASNGTQNGTGTGDANGTANGTATATPPIGPGPGVGSSVTTAPTSLLSQLDLQVLSVVIIVSIGGILGVWADRLRTMLSRPPSRRRSRRAA